MPTSELNGLLKLLDQIKGWRQIKEAPARIDALEARIEALEAALSKPQTKCPKCGSTDLDIGEMTPDTFASAVGLNEYHLRHTCRSCGTTWEKTVTS